jgi:hypothetical protein
MEDFEKQLREALRRSHPPPGFAERVLARAAAEGAPKAAWWRLGRKWASLRWALAGGLAARAAFAGVFRYQERRGELAKERLLVALSIAGEKLHYAQRKVHEVTLPGEAANLVNSEDKQ